MTSLTICDKYWRFGSVLLLLGGAVLQSVAQATRPSVNAER